jgi:hypothetical protein
VEGDSDKGSGALERWTPNLSHRPEEGGQVEIKRENNNQQAVQVNSGQLPSLTGNSEYPESMLIDLRMSSHLNLKK